MWILLKTKYMVFFTTIDIYTPYFIEPGIKLVYLIYRNCDFKKIKFN